MYMSYVHHTCWHHIIWQQNTWVMTLPWDLKSLRDLLDLTNTQYTYWYRFRSYMKSSNWSTHNHESWSICLPLNQNYSTRLRSSIVSFMQATTKMCPMNIRTKQWQFTCRIGMELFAIKCTVRNPKLSFEDVFGPCIIRLCIMPNLTRSIPN